MRRSRPVKTFLRYLTGKIGEIACPAILLSDLFSHPGNEVVAAGINVKLREYFRNWDVHGAADAVVHT